LMALHTCDIHKPSRKYKLISAPVDWEIASRLSVARLEGRMEAHEKRMGESVRQFPMFTKRLQLKKVTIPYLLEEGKDGKK